LDLGGKQFSFEPYDYGPFDRAVYSELKALAQQGFVTIVAAPGAGKRRYSLTAAGYEALGEGRCDRIEFRSSQPA
jgi:uncharacterized protein